MEEKKSLRVVLDGEHLEMFEEIKEENNLKYDSETIRYCISETNKETEFKLKESYWIKIKELMQYDFVKFTHHIYDIPTFVNRALENFIEAIEQETNSLLSFQVRSNLSGIELDVAIAFIECQEEDPANQVDVNSVAKKMNKRNIGELQKILNDFSRRGLLIKQHHNETTYYHAKPP